MRALNLRTWWTGEDSNPRSSQGAAGLQPAAIDRSATCPKLFPTTPELGVFSSAAGPYRLKTNRRIVFRRGPTVAAVRVQYTNYKPLFRDPALLSPVSAGCQCRKLTISAWSWRRDSNPRPSDYKSDALPAELRQRPQTSNYRDSVSELQ